MAAIVRRQLIPAVNPPPPINDTKVALAEDTATQPFHWHYSGITDNSNQFQVHGHGLTLVIITFTIILVFAIVCIYLKCACRYQRVVITVSNRGGTATSTTTTMTQVKGLDKVTIDSLPVRIQVVVEIGEESPQCSICLGGLVEGEKVKFMPDCGHGFHQECIDRWLRSHPTCPLCRASLKPVPVAKTVDVEPQEEEEEEEV